MYIAMNRFKISNDHLNDFIEIWRSRDSLLKEAEGFSDFKLLEGTKKEDHTIFISHSTWESEKHFKAWTDSDHFKKAHGGARAPKGTYLEHPKFEGFNVVLDK